MIYTYVGLPIKSFVAVLVEHGLITRHVLPGHGSPLLNPKPLLQGEPMLLKQCISLPKFFNQILMNYLRVFTDSMMRLTAKLTPEKRRFANDFEAPKSSHVTAVSAPPRD